MKIRSKPAIGAIVLVFYLTLAVYSAATLLKQFTFNEDAAFKGWNRMVLNGQVDYELVKRGTEGYVQALSEKACSALYYRIGFGLRDYPVLSWRWKVLKFPDISAAKTDQERDDYAARVYVIFPFLNFSSSKFIEYIWSENLLTGTIMNSPSGNNVKMIVARTGMPKDDSWVYESRNVYDDYVKAFGTKPNMNAGAIAIMCDADSTKTVAEALFDDITIASQAGIERSVDSL